MRKTLLFLLLMCTKLTFAQLHDNFTDGNFTENPIWTGQTSQFAITGDKKLTSILSSVEQVVTLSAASRIALNAKWEFSVELKFDPSAANLARIYLISDKEDLRSSLNGYFLQIGESGGKDSYDLYKQTGKSIRKIIDCPAKNRANMNYLSTKIQVTRDNFGKWQIFSAVPNSSQYELEGSVIDKDFIITNYFGIYAKYTATRSDGFAFDDFRVEELADDLTPPRILGIEVTGEYELEVEFSEPLAPSSALIPSNYIIKEHQAIPITAKATGKPNVVKLNFVRPFESARYTLVVYNLEDLKGNMLTADNEVSTFFVKPYIALKGDVVINEIFADPSPPVGLPSVEFVEIWNTTPHYIILTEWKLADLTSTVNFLADTLKPDEYLILSAAPDTNQFNVFGRTLGLSKWPSLNNDKDRLRLISVQNAIIDEVSYHQNWYKDTAKNQGGYSLELIDPDNVCIGTQNWEASSDKIGGTPGRENSVYRKQIITTAPKILRTTQINETTIRIEFDKSIDSLSGSFISCYSLNNGMGAPESAIPQYPDFTSVLLKWTVRIGKGKMYTLSVNQVSDCAGNMIAESSRTQEFFIPKEVSVNDILLSEILVNPRAGGIDFIELYNNTSGIRDLATLKLATIDNNGNSYNITKISDTPVYIPANGYWVLSTNSETIKQQYEVKHPSNFTEMVKMPAYPNEKGTVVLLSDEGIIDRFDYHEGMHFPLLQIVKGVSLERVSFRRKANESGNFKSAAQTSGFGTPTYKNSQQESFAVSNKVWLSNKVFSPDGDGVDDALQINFEFPEQEYVASITIFNERGTVVRRLVRNSSIPKVGNFVWDGLADTGNLNRIGIYIVKFELFTLTGEVKSFELVSVLALKLN